MGIFQKSREKWSKNDSFWTLFWKMLKNDEIWGVRFFQILTKLGKIAKKAHPFSSRIKKSSKIDGKFSKKLGFLVKFC